MKSDITSMYAGNKCLIGSALAIKKALIFSRISYNALLKKSLSALYANYTIIFYFLLGIDTARWMSSNNGKNI
jgi:uncharacterized membrane protein